MKRAIKYFMRRGWRKPVLLLMVWSLFAVAARAQDSQFSFDATGNLFSQSAESAGLPQILGQPQMRIVVPGRPASFSVHVANASGVSYQWFFNNAPIAGATQDTLLVANASSTDEGTYQVQVSNASGPVNSTAANLYIDSDDDGLPDSWEIAHFGSLGQNATGDFDGDGISNLQEFLDGTNPSDAISALYHLNIANDGGAVTVTPNQPAYTKGQVVTLTAIEDNGAPFHAWTGDLTTRSNSITVTMSTNMTLFAHFLPFTLTWTNHLNGDWSVATNWSPNLAPSTNENVVISPAITVTQNNDVVLSDFSLGGIGPGPTLIGSGRITIIGIGSWLGGTMSGGATIVAPGATFTIANPSTVSLLDHTIDNFSTTLWLSGGFMSIQKGIFINEPGAQFVLPNASAFNAGGNDSRFDNFGTLIAVSGATTLTGVAFNNFGTLNVTGGTFSMNGGGTYAGIETVAAGANIRFAGGTFTNSGNPSLTGAGNLLLSGATATLGGLVNVTGSNIFSGGSVDFVGNYICTNNSMIISGTSASFDGTGIVAPATLSLSGAGVLGGAQNVTVSQSMSWVNGGSMSGAGHTIIPAGVTLTINNPSSTIALNGRTLDNMGTVTWSGLTMVMNDGVITNEPGAMFQVQGPLSLNNNSGSPRFDNAGTFNIAGAAAINFVGVPLNNFNTVNIPAGSLVLGGGGNNSGAISVAAGATIDFNGRTFSTSGNPSLTGGGNLIVNSGSATLGGLSNLTGSNIFSGGAVDFVGNYICTNTMIISGSAASFDGTGVVAPALLSLSGGGNLGGAQTVTIGQSMTWSGGGMSGSGRTIIPPNATLTISNPASIISISGRALDNAGTASWSGLSMSMNDGVITNEIGATFQIQGPLSLNNNGGAPHLDNAGTFIVAGNTNINLNAVPFNNSGTVNLQGGTLGLGGGGTNSGTISVMAGATFNLKSGTFFGTSSSSLTGAGNLAVTAGNATVAGLVDLGGSNVFSAGSIDFTGVYICTNSPVTIVGGTASFDGSSPLSLPIVNMTAGALGGNQNVTITKSMSWSGGTMSGSGQTIIPAGAALNISNPANVVTLSGRTLDNAGTISWSGLTMAINGSVITNEPGALFQAQSASGFNFGGGSPRFDNAGTFRAFASPGTFAFNSVPLTNSGTMDIENGILQVNGSYVATTNAVLNCGLGGPNVGLGYGQLKVSGTLSLNGTLSVTLTNNYIPTTNDSFIVVTNATRVGSFARFLYPSNALSMIFTNTVNATIVKVTGPPVLQPPLVVVPPPHIIGSTIQMAWSVVPNQIYRVEVNPGLDPAGWVPLGPDIIATNDILMISDDITRTNHFYRIRALP